MKIKTYDAKRMAIQIAQDLKGVNNSDNVIYNIEQVCDYVIDILESVVGSQRHLRTEHENETLEFWSKVKKESKNLKF